MSLASFLTGNGHGNGTVRNKVDAGLDALFRSNAAPPIAPPPQTKAATTPSDPTHISPPGGHKRKRKHVSHDVRPTVSSSLIPPIPKSSKRRKEADFLEPRVGSSTDGSDEADEDEDSGLEDAYLTRHAHAIHRSDESSSEPEFSAEDDDDDEPPQHETQSTTSPKKHSKPHRKAKYIPPDETPAQRDARTIFVGNIPVDVAKSKSSKKQLKQHFTSRISGAKIESVRFRSVAFASATSALPAEDGKPPRSTAMSTKQQRQKERATTWREAGGENLEGEDGHGASKKPSILTPAEKKRVAFIKKDFHKEVDTLNAYIVFAHASPDDTTDVISPIEAARLAVALCDASTFLDRTLRIDRVGQWRTGSGEEDPIGNVGDPRATVFVGNLDFAAREEDLRIWFEGVVSQVRGPPGTGDADDGEAKWVHRVRIVRDRDTQLGKGFAYVRFADRECVDEVLALEPESLKFAKRKLRVQRCKVVRSGDTSPSKSTTKRTSKPSSKSKSSASAPMAQKSASAKAPVHVPAGDPLLGAKLAGLSKEDRKAAKAADADRVQRRLAKKKARMGAERELQKRTGKVRDRERKKGRNADKPKSVHKKGRVRSEKDTDRKNRKK